MKFTKMHGIGNDYVYVNCFEEQVPDPERTAVYVSDRHFGIGSDGLILIQPSETADCRMDMYNLDGSRGMMCGNGVRCVGKYVYDHGLVPADRRRISVETLSGIKYLDLQVEDGKVKELTVDMGEPEVISQVPEQLSAAGIQVPFIGISMGNPHAVVFLEGETAEQFAPWRKAERTAVRRSGCETEGSGLDVLDLSAFGPAFENHNRLLLRHPVHGGGTVVGIADLVVYTGVVQNTLGGSSLTGVDVRHDADISGSLQGIFSRHIALLSNAQWIAD